MPPTTQVDSDPHEPMVDAATKPAATGSFFVRTLVWKNFLLKRKHPVKWALELLLPVALIVVLGSLKALLPDIAIPDGWANDASPDNKTGTGYSLWNTTASGSPRFVATETTMSAYLMQLAFNSYDQRLRTADRSAVENVTCGEAAWAGNVSSISTDIHAWPALCRPFVVPHKIAIVPDTSFTRDYFLKTLATWYPRVPLSTSLAVPAVADSVVFFDSDAALNAYIAGADYGQRFDTPVIEAAIVFTTMPSTFGVPGNIEYTLRLNATLGRSNAVGDVPRTVDDVVDPLQRALELDPYTRYATSGFFTLQTLVTRFATCVPDWTNGRTSGQCTVEQATAVDTAATNKTLLEQQLPQDLVLKKLLGTAAAFLKQPPVDTTKLDSETAASLARPLRQLPQATGGATVFPFPIERYTSSPFYKTVQSFFGLLFVFSYLQCLSSILVALISEKETKNRELLKILGVPDSAIVCSWYITYAVVLVVAAVLQTVAASAILFPNANVVLLFAFFLLFAWSLMAYGYMVSAIFSKSRTGTYMGIIGFFIMYLITSGFNATSAESAKQLACLLPPVALVFGVESLASAESAGVGITFDNVANSIRNFQFVHALVFLAIDIVLYTLLGLYLEKVVPKEYGTTEPWYFLFSRAYWTKSHAKVVHQNSVAIETNVALNVLHDSIEDVGMDLKQQELSGEALQIRSLRKVFKVPGGTKTAVKGLDLTMYKNQITCLLGHNGAGKTTLISMLTGMIPVSGGDATVHGLSLTQDMDAIRRSMGVCPQHDVLYPELTVEEHLVFYSKIKGFGGQALVDQVDTSIAEVGLTEKRHVRSSDLSGGMKRKLSLAIALLGDSQIVFLDEPTSGMDPYSRRSSWEIIMNNRQNRIVVLTTHFMDEADILGDRIAIMAEGELRCCGSSLFLKNRYGAGYNFSLVKTDACNASDLVAFVNHHVGGRAKVLSNVGTEIAFQLPLDCSPLFGAMFAELDEQKQLLGVVSYGISVTTMEEVFIKVAELGDETQQHTLAHNQPKTAPMSLTTSGYKLPSERPSSTFTTHFMALLKKRYRIAKRDRRVVLYGILLPVLFLVLGIALLKTSTLNKNEPRMVLSMADYPKGDRTPVPFTCQSDWLCDALPRHGGAAPYDLQLSTSPLPSPVTVFGIQYTALSATKDTCLRASTEIWSRGYKSSSLITGQYGGMVLFGSAASRVFGYNVAVNTTAKHSAALHKAIADEALYRAVVNRPDVTLRVASQPLPLTDTSKVLFSAMVGYLTSFFAILAFAFFAASVVPHLVQEKHAMSNAKHQQLISGVSLTAFWLANFVWDLAMFAVPCVSGLVAIYLFDISAFSGRDCASCTDTPFAALTVLLVLLGGALISFCYVVSFVLKDPASSQVYIIMIQMSVGLMLTIVSLVLDIIESTRSTNKALKFLWRLSPLFCVGNGLNAVSSRTIMISRGLDPRASAFSTDVMGWDIIYLGLEAILFPILAITIDYMRTFPSLRHQTKTPQTVEAQDPQVQDEDVVAEEHRVAGGGAESDAVVLRQLRKVYDGGKVAVTSVSLGLPKGECFGYLGINGAGKTTTMKILTGDIVATSGSATLGGFDILSQQLDVRRLIGYCPQFDALIDLLTVREHLELFASIKGIPSSHVNDTVVGLMGQMNLNDFEHKLAGTLSGGNKRKLSVAIAMIGSPPIIFLDEPSTGMDPVSRRFMWDVIADISTRSKESTILLTTHSMEECEALCTRVGIMVGGGLRCLGSVQHLKHRFGDGLSLHVKATSITSADAAPMLAAHFAAMPALTRADVTSVCAALGRPGRADAVRMDHATGYVVADALETNGLVRSHDFCAWWLGEDNFDVLARYLESVFGADNVQLVERQHDVSRFKLLGTKDRIALSHVFPTIERAKHDLHIQDYTVSQTTLEQIFNGFAAKQMQEQGGARGLLEVPPTAAHDDHYHAHAT